jgi:hypothetical protein
MMVALKSRLNRGLNIEKPEKFNNFISLKSKIQKFYTIGHLK